MAMRRKGKKTEIRYSELGTKEIYAAVRARRRELMDVRFETARAGTAPAGRILALRKEIARGLTELGKRA